jgi:predicted small secreted protein
MKKQKLLVALLAPSALLAGCNAVFGIGDLDVVTADAGDDGGALDGRAPLDATVVRDAGTDATATADAADGSSDAKASAEASPGTEAGSYCATFGAGAIVCDDYDQDAELDVPGEHMVLQPTGMGSVRVLSGADAPPSPPNVLATMSVATIGSVTGQAGQYYDPDAAAPGDVIVELQVYLEEPPPSPPSYIVPLTVNLLGDGTGTPYNLELALDSASIVLLSLPQNAPTGTPPQNSDFSVDAALSAMTWHQVTLKLHLGQVPATPTVTVWLSIDGVMNVTNQDISHPGGYGAPEIVVGNAFVASDSGARTVYIDNLLVTAPD